MKYALIGLLFICGCGNLETPTKNNFLGPGAAKPPAGPVISMPVPQKEDAVPFWPDGTEVNNRLNGRKAIVIQHTGVVAHQINVITVDGLGNRTGETWWDCECEARK